MKIRKYRLYSAISRINKKKGRWSLRQSEYDSATTDEHTG